MQYMGEEEITVYVNNVAKIRDSQMVYVKCIYAGIAILYAQ